MKKILLFSMLFVSVVVLQAQNFTINTDSVYVIHQVGSPIYEDTTAAITITNTTSSPLKIKATLTYEDVSPGLAMIDYFPLLIHSNNGIGFTDSLTIMGNDVAVLECIFNQPLFQSKCEVEITVYDPLDSVNTFQVLSFVLINCQSSSNIIMNPTGFYCSTDSINLTANTNYSGYLWSTGDTSQTIRVLASDQIYIDATDSLGCISRDTSSIDVSIPYEEQICIVSVDSVTGKNIVVWEKTAMQGTEQYYVYKESFQAGVYNLIGFVAYDSLSVFIDVNSNPLQQAERYKITAVDSCGSESDVNMSTDHKTIHLTASIGTGNENNLVWDGYEGFSFPTYNIYRGATPSTMTLLTQVASSAFTYSDLTPLAGSNYYKVEAVRSSSCSPSQKPVSYPSSISNQVTLNPLGINSLDADNVSVYPNPMQNLLMIDLGATYKNINISVKNILGTTVLIKTYKTSNKIELNNNLKEGVYFIEIMVDGNKLATKKVVKR